MKKRIWAMVLVLALCLAFSGCTLDSMRKSHAINVEEDKIVWNGVSYLALSNNVTISPEMDYETRIYVTRPDVPLLLQSIFGSSVLISKDGRFLEGWYGETYCRSDCYEEIAEMVRNPGVLEYFCYHSAYVGKTLRISKEDSQWLRNILEELEPLENGNSEDDKTVPTQVEFTVYEYVAELTACNQDMLLQQYAYSIYITEEGYLFERYSEEIGGYVQLLFPEEETEKLESVLKLKP